MANPHKGDVAFEAGGNRYCLRYSVDALCALEDVTGRGLPALLADMEDANRLKITLVRQLVWAGLREHHPGIDLKAAGELILEAGGLMEMIAIVTRAVQLAFPQAESGEPRPPQPGPVLPTGPDTGGAG